METPTNPQTSPETIQAPDFNIVDTVKQAWADTNGTKLTYWGALLLLFLVAFGFGIVDSMCGGGEENTNLLGVILNLGYNIISVILVAGMSMMGIRRARGEEIKSMMIFDQFDKAFPLLIFSILTTIILALGFLLLIIPGIYLSVGYLFAVPLIIDKNLGAWEAMETSRKLVTTRWLQYFMVILLFGVVAIISAIPFGIGLIWTIPMGYNLMGNLYKDAFG